MTTGSGFVPVIGDHGLALAPLETLNTGSLFDKLTAPPPIAAGPTQLSKEATWVPDAPATAAAGRSSR